LPKGGSSQIWKPKGEGRKEACSFARLKARPSVRGMGKKNGGAADLRVKREETDEIRGEKNGDLWCLGLGAKSGRVNMSTNGGLHDANGKEMFKAYRKKDPGPAG